MIKTLRWKNECKHKVPKKMQTIFKNLCILQIYDNMSIVKCGHFCFILVKRYAMFLQW